MALFPLGTVLSAAPGLISAAADLIKVIRERKRQPALETGDVEEEKYRQLEALIEQQALLVEELALNNRNLTLALRNNRRLSLISLLLAVVAVVLSLVL